MIIEKNGYIVIRKGDNNCLTGKGNFVSLVSNKCKYAKFFMTEEKAKEFACKKLKINLENFENKFRVIEIQLSCWLDIDNEEEERFVINKPIIKFAKLDENAKIPSKKTGNVGYDIYACFDDNYIKILPHETKLIPTKIASIIPEGYAIILKDRGSTGSKGISTACGVIDSNFRGEWFVALHNENEIPVYIIKDCVEVEKEEAIYYPYTKAITQAILVDDFDATVEEVDKEIIESDITDRGTGIIGSSGK